MIVEFVALIGGFGRLVFGFMTVVMWLIVLLSGFGVVWGLGWWVAFGFWVSDCLVLALVRVCGFRV